MAIVTAYVALGSNIGDRAAHLRAAVRRLGDLGRVLATSSVIETPAVGGPSDSPSFLNAAAALSTSLPPGELLRHLLAIESDLGRVRRERWGPRTLDLDLLLYAEQVIDAADLVVPHPRMHERRFVLAPLAEIAPNVVHPRLGRRVADLLLDLHGSR